ncbi:Peroxisome biogenesis factor 1 [Trachymyrmex septentrionalis]|uniref:Peroxisomal ATPase PEX1 n=1 Tax=Trachymyrmex septentrionalis TaxID=34720 RepID=A0A195FUW7_9HYME|nr:PREDICTED: peroxisome biogenesis protein 1 [Trachymyrmex septentrionalis]XP_018351208.1 PREDICTED: peroxisome biogenesis protein 1 [Trachymyrmex septentrionalis]KYN44445.1 Peroxisome biogenesis factor 1 [Trachymyrmex septentrionalis]
MQHERFVVKYIAVNNCFAHLSAIWLRRLETKENAIEISHNEKKYYLSCIARVNNDETLCIGATFARSLNIQEGDEVLVSSVKSVPSLSSIQIAPRTTSDRELLELQMERVQSSLLSQVRIVAKGQPLVAWISKFSSVTFIAEDSEPKFAYGLLEEFTEVHVLDAIASSTIKDEVVKKEEANTKIANPLAKILPYFAKRKDHRDSRDNAANYALLQSFRNRSVPRVFRVYPLPDFRSSDQLNAHDMILQGPCHILIPRSCAPKNIRPSGIMMCKVKKVPENRQYVNVTNTNFLKDDSSLKSPQELVVRIYILEDILDKCSASLDREYFDLNSIHSCIYVSASLRITLGLKVGSRVIVQMIEGDESPPRPSLVNVFPFNQSVTPEVFTNYVKLHSRHEPLLLNSGATILLEDGERCVVRMSPADCDYATIDGKDVKDLVVLVSSASDPSDGKIPQNCPEQNSRMEKISTRCIEGILENCEIALDLSLGLRRAVDFLYDRENILICGAMGSGKTTICKKLIECYCEAPCFVHTHVIDCRLLKGKKVETMQKIITSVMHECVYYQPSILFLDNLESITNASVNDEENTIDATNASRITDMLIKTVKQYQECHYISIVATCANVSKIGSRLRPVRGAQFFRTVLQIPNLEKVDRIDILRLTLEDKLCVPGDMNWNYYGNKTEGWMPQDIVDLAEKARFVTWKRHAAERLKVPIIVTEEDINTALEGFTPMSLQGVQLYKSSDHSWSDIGGLASTKTSLTEILQWPLKYPEIFKNAPIKLQSGVLLYGMPGTGKTMLAKAIANECGVNLISIKGPELLSKYIGVSEESVRNVFERACRAKPCVLFFDEFDSLAPRRGHDSTGVTDRVVNQLLTQLDGVEDREGVAVVAASSRPDLLDPALLRPGRLDKCLHCPLPNELEREEIFTVLCNAQNIDTAVLDLKILAQLSDGFTGADINAVITSAKLSAFEDALATATDGKVSETAIKVTQTHLVESVKSTRPSLSTAEKLKYTKIYARFSKGDNFTEDVKNQKATLA